MEKLLTALIANVLTIPETQASEIVQYINEKHRTVCFEAGVGFIQNGAEVADHWFNVSLSDDVIKERYILLLQFPVVEIYIEIHQSDSGKAGVLLDDWNHIINMRIEDK